MLSEDKICSMLLEEDTACFWEGTKDSSGRGKRLLLLIEVRGYCRERTEDAGRKQKMLVREDRACYR